MAQSVATPGAAAPNADLAGAAVPGAVGTDAGATDAATRGDAGTQPAGTIRSVANADAALRDVAQQRTLVEARYEQDRQDCAPVFFMTHCLDKAREQRRTAMVELRPVEVEANAFKRRARVEERDRILAEKNADAPKETVSASRETMAGTPPPALPPTTAMPAMPITSSIPVKTGASAAAKAHRPKSIASRPAPSTRAATLPKSQAPVIDPATEARNIAAFEKKQAESAKRQRKVADTKARKEQERAKKQAAAAAAKKATP